MGDNGFRGTSIEQDGRFSGQKEERMLRSVRFPACYAEPVDLARVDEAFVRKWIDEQVTRAQGREDEILAGYVAEELYAGAAKDGEQRERVDPRRLQLRLTAFLDDRAPQFVEALWSMLLEAQASPGGIPPSAADALAKKEEDKEVQGRGQEQQVDAVRERDDPEAHERERERVHARRRTTSRSRSRSWSVSRSRSRSPSRSHSRHHSRHRSRHHHHRHHHRHHSRSRSR